MKKHIEMMSFMVAIVVLTMASIASATPVTIYSNDFEGGSGSEALESGTFGAWSAELNAGLLVTSGIQDVVAGGLSGDGIQGDGTVGRFLGSTITPAGLDMTDPLATEYEFTFNAYAVSGSTGTSWGGAGFAASGGPHLDFGLYYRRAGNGGWAFFTGDIGGGTEVIGNQYYLNDREVLGTITVDLVNNEARARLDEIGGPQSHVFAPVSLGGSINGVNSLLAFSDVVAASDDGADLDNFHLTKTIPEPATMGLLMLGLAGMSMFRPKR